MMTIFSQWLLYFASYSLAYLCLFVEVLYLSIVNNKEEISFIQKLSSGFSDNAVILLILGILILFSIMYTMSIKRWKNHTRIRQKMVRNVTFEMSCMLATYIFPLIFAGINPYIGFATFVALWAVGLAVVRSGYAHFCCAFLFLGFRVYTNDEITVITKLRMERFNLIIDEDTNGIQARRISNNVYIVMDT